MPLRDNEHQHARAALATWVVDRATLKRSVLVAALVGPVLTVINQADAIFGARALEPAQAALTLLVPFIVSSLSGVMASRRAQRDRTTRERELFQRVEPVAATVDQIRANAASVNGTARARYGETKALLLRARQAIDEIEGGAALVQDALKATAEVQQQFHAVLAAEAEVRQEIQHSAGSAVAVSSAVAVARARLSEIAALAHDIDRLGHQTTLLSLNAAVVAATAGAEGKRFAAIGESIRELARATEAQAKKIDATTRELEQSAAAMAEESGRLRTGQGRLLASSDAAKLALAHAADAMHRSVSPTRASLDLLARQSLQIRTITDGIGRVVDHAEAAIEGSARNMALARGVVDELDELMVSGLVFLRTDRS